jgi:hypothetical protein
MHFANLWLRRSTAAALAVSAVLMAGSSICAEPATGVSAAPQAPKPKLTEVTTPSAPRAAQIEPMVDPVKRVAPQTPENKDKAAKSSPAPDPKKILAKTRDSRQKNKPVNKIAAKINKKKKH